MVVAVAVPASAEDAAERQTRLISPAGLGPSYSGLAGAGVGIKSTLPRFGVRTGEFVLQPRFFLEGYYTTNFFREDTRSTFAGRASETDGVFNLQLRPGVGLYNPGAKKVGLQVALDANIRVPLSGEERVTNHTNLGGTLSANAVFFPKGAFTLALSERFTRTLWTRPAGTDNNANRNHNLVGPDLILHPGGGALEFKAGYRYELHRYDDIDTLAQSGHKFSFLGTWRFYPLTHVFLESTFTLRDYDDVPEAVTSQLGNYVPAMPLKAYLGLSGYISERFALLVRAGYGNSFMDADSGRAPDDFSSFIGMLQATIRFTGRTVLHLGGARDFELSPFGGYYTFWRGYLSFEQQIGNLVLLHLDFAFDQRSFGEWRPAPFDYLGSTITPTISDRERSEQLLRGGALLDFHISRLFGFTLGYRIDALLSEFFTTYSTDLGRSQNYVGYVDHKIIATLNLRY